MAIKRGWCAATGVCGSRMQLHNCCPPLLCPLTIAASLLRQLSLCCGAWTERTTLTEASRMRTPIRWGQRALAGGAGRAVSKHWQRRVSLGTPPTPLPFHSPAPLRTLPCWCVYAGAAEFGLTELRGAGRREIGSR